MNCYLPQSSDTLLPSTLEQDFFLTSALEQVIEATLNHSASSDDILPPEILASFPSYSNASTSTEPTHTEDEPSLGAAVPILTKKGAQGIMFERRKYSFKYKTKAGTETWRCRGHSSCRASIIVRKDDDKFHILQIKQAHSSSCLEKPECDESYLRKVRSVVLNGDNRPTRQIAKEENLPYSHALYKKRQRVLSQRSASGESSL